MPENNLIKLVCEGSSDIDLETFSDFLSSFGVSEVSVSGEKLQIYNVKFNSENLCQDFLSKMKNTHYLIFEKKFFSLLDEQPNQDRRFQTRPLVLKKDNE